MNKINLRAELERIVSTIKSYLNHVNDLCKGRFKFEKYKVKHYTYQVRVKVA